MRRIRDILRLRWEGGLSIRQISAGTKVSVGGVQKLLAKASALALSWPLPETLNDEQLARLFYPGADSRASARFQMPEWSAQRPSLRRARSVPAGFGCSGAR